MYPHALLVFAVTLSVAGRGQALTVISVFRCGGVFTAGPGLDAARAPQAGGQSDRSGAGFLILLRKVTDLRTGKTRPDFRRGSARCQQSWQRLLGQSRSSIQDLVAELGQFRSHHWGKDARREPFKSTGEDRDSLPDRLGWTRCVGILFAGPCGSIKYALCAGLFHRALGPVFGSDPVLRRAGGLDPEGDRRG